MRILIVLLSILLTVFSHVSFANPLSLEEKIGQMLIIGFEGKSVTADAPIVKAIEDLNLGGVILFDYNARTKQFDKNIANPQQVKLLNDQLQQITQHANHLHQREPLPLIIAVDYEGGKVNRLKEEYGFPRTMSQKQIGELPLDNVNIEANTMANTLQFSGFNLNFAPVLDVDVNPNNPIIGKLERSFSADPLKVAQDAEIFSKQYVSHKVQCAYKHFPGHGSSTSDSHLGFVDVTDTWHDEELLPYQQLLQEKNHCGMIMSAHIVNRKLDATGLPATLSRVILTDLLRHQLNFDGVIVTDDMQMKAIADHYGLAEAVTLSINAGADMLIFGNQLVDIEQDPKEIIHMIKEKVDSGEISEDRINDAYERICQLKRSI